MLVVMKAAATEDTTKKKAAAKRLETDVPKDAILVRLTGMTVDIEAIPRMMRDLEASPFIESVQLERSELQTSQQKEVHQFTLVMNYTRADSTAVHRVPFRIAGR